MAHSTDDNLPVRALLTEIVPPDLDGWSRDDLLAFASGPFALGLRTSRLGAGLVAYHLRRLTAEGEWTQLVTKIARSWEVTIGTVGQWLKLAEAEFGLPVLVTPRRQGAAKRKRLKPKKVVDAKAKEVPNEHLSGLEPSSGDTLLIEVQRSASGAEATAAAAENEPGSSPSPAGSGNSRGAQGPTTVTKQVLRTVEYATVGELQALGRAVVARAAERLASADGRRLITAEQWEEYTALKRAQSDPFGDGIGWVRQLATYEDQFFAVLDALPVDRLRPSDWTTIPERIRKRAYALANKKRDEMAKRVGAAR